MLSRRQRDENGQRRDRERRAEALRHGLKPTGLRHTQECAHEKRGGAP
jgi:hypothetical protein